MKTLADPPPAEERAASAKTTGIVALAVMSSRVLGLVREVLFANCFNGATRDAFVFAFKIPNLLRDLFAEGALSTAFITVFSQKLKTEGEASAWALAHKIITLVAVFMTGITLLGIAGAGLIVELLSTGWSQEKQELTALLTRIMFPFILLVSLAALVMGMLNARRVFGVPAMASSCFNIMSIVGGFGMAWIFDDPDIPWFDWKGLVWVSIGTLLGGLAQLGIQLPSLRRVGYRFRPDFSWRGDPGLRRVLFLMLPSVIAGSAVQVNVLVNTAFAGSLPQSDGPMSWLNVAFRLMQLPLGVFGVAVATVTLPVISRVATDGINATFREVLGGGLRLVTFLTLPCAAGLFILAHPIISVIYERGAFAAWETAATAGALRWYAIGLVFYSCIKVIQPSFTAIDRNRIPMYVAFLSIGVNASLNWLFVRVLGKDHTWLALTTAVVAGLNFVILYVALSRIAHGLDGRRLAASLARLLLPLAGLSFVAWVAWHSVLERQWAALGFLPRCVGLGLAITASGTAYALLAHLLRVDEARQFADLLERRRRRRA